MLTNEVRRDKPFESVTNASEVEASMKMKACVDCISQTTSVARILIP